MLLYISKFDNNFNEKKYNSQIKKIDLFNSPCPKCTHTECLSFHAEYNRSFTTDNGNVRFAVKRCICSNCRSTHAILPSFVVPYSPILLDDACEIIEADDQQKKEDIMVRLALSIDQVRRIKRIFTLFWSRLMSDYRSCTDLTSFCIQSFNLQFLQVRYLFLSLIST